MHQVQAPPVDGVPRLLVEMQVEREEVARGYDPVQILGTAEEFGLQFVEDLGLDRAHIDGHNAHAEGAGAARQILAAGAEAAQSQRPSFQLHARGPIE